MILHHEVGRARRDLQWMHFLLVLLVVASLAAGLGMREPSPPDEPRFALAARDMVQSGQWLFPHRGSQFYAEKPPVFMWLQAAGYRVTGDLLVAFLLPSLLAALLTLWLVHDLARRLWTRGVADHAAAALFVCLQFGLQAKRGQIDMVLVAMTTVSMWAMLRHLLQGPQWPLLWLGMFMAGVGTVTKGVGFLPLLVLLPWLALRRYRPDLRGTPALPGDGWRWAGGAAAFVCGTLVWLGPMLLTVALSDDPHLKQYASELLLRQTGQRYAHAWHHVQPAWYYLQVMATLWLPGALLLPWLLPAWRRRLRRGDRPQWLLLGWSALVLIFFSFSAGKREVYIFPALPALCLAAAPLLPGLLRRVAVQRTLSAYMLGMGLVASLLALSALTGTSDWAERLAHSRAIEAEAASLFLVWLLGFGVVALALVMVAQLRAGPALVAFTAVLWITYGTGLAPAIDADSSARALMQRVDERIGPTAQLGMVAWREQHLLQSVRPAIDFGFKNDWQEQWRQAAPWLGADPERRWVFVMADAVSPCVEPSRIVPVGMSNRREWVLVPGAALLPDCVTPPLRDSRSVNAD